MALLEEARRQLDAEVYAYIRSMQPAPPLALSLNNGVGAAAAAVASKVLASAADSAARAVLIKPPKSHEAGGGASDEPHDTPHASRTAKPPNVKQARARLCELIKKLQCATLVTTQVSSTDNDAAPALRRRASKSALKTQATIHPEASAAAARHGGNPTGARGRAANADTVEDAAATRAGSRPPSPPHGLARIASTVTSSTTAGTGRGNAAEHNTRASLRRLNASLAFTRDCLHYAATLAEAGLGSDAQSFFLQPIAHDITSPYESVLARCVEQQSLADGDPLQNSGNASAGSAASAAATTAMRTPRRQHLSLGGGRGREDRKRTSTAGCSENAGSSGARAAAEDANVEEGVRVTDALDVFAPDVPLPLALRLHKCVLRYRALSLYIQFGEIMKSDVYGDAAGFATALEACACVEQLVALEQRVLRTPAFNAASIRKREEEKLKEDVGQATDAPPKTVDTIVVAGCRLVDLMAEPPMESPSSVALVRNTHTRDGEAAPRIYAVEGTAAPVLFSMRQYVANMCQRLLAYLSTTSAVATAAADMTSSPPSVAHAANVASSVVRRLIEALRTSLSMSELHHVDTHGPAAAAQNTTDERLRGGGGDKTCIPLAAVEYLPWRLHEYSLLQSCYMHLQEDPSSAPAAVAVAQRALHQVLQLMELEYFDPVPPPASSVYLLESAVQQCAGQLLVAIWRAALVQDGSPSAMQLASAAEMVPKSAANGSSCESPRNSTATAATASSTMVSIIALIQQTVAHLLSVQCSSPPAASAPSLVSLPPRATQQRGQGSGNSTDSMNGTRLLVVLWTCIAQVQQQCMLLAGKSEAADALRAAATSGVQHDDGDTSGDGASEPASGKGPVSQSARASLSPGGGLPAAKSAKKGKASTSSGGAAASAKHKLGKEAEEAAQLSQEQAAEATAAAGESSFPLPTSIAHPHPSVVALAARFPHMALELTLQLITTIEAAGATPCYTGGTDSGNSSGGSEAAARSSMGAQWRLSKADAGFGAKDGADRKSLKSTRSRAASMTSFSETAAAAAAVSTGAGASTLFAGVHIRTPHTMYRHCVETLEVLLHGAAMAATELAPVGAETSAPPSSWGSHGSGTRLGALTHAAVLRDAVDTLRFADGVDVVAAGAAGAVGGAANGPCASTDTTAVGTSHVEQQTAHEASLTPRCFLYNTVDARCLSRSLTWEALFLPSSLMAPGTAAALAARGAREDVEDGVQRSVAAFRTLAMASSQLAIVVRIGVALESWWRSQRQQAATSAKLAAATTASSTAKGAISKKLNNSATALRLLPRSSTTATRSVAMEACIRCIELLRALALNVMIQRHQHRVAKDKSALTATLLAFAAVERALNGADAPATSINPLLPPVQSPTEELAEYARLYSLAQVGQRLSQLQRRCIGGGDRHVREVGLREFTESTGLSSVNAAAGSRSNSSGGAGGDSLPCTSAQPQSLQLYRASAALLDKVTAALCALPPPPTSSSVDGASESVASSGVTAMVAGGLRTPMMTALSVLKPVVADVASFLLRCGGELRSQWQRHRALRQLRQATTVHGDATKPNASAVTADAPLSADERELNAEATYATVVLCVLTSMWRSGISGGSGGMQLPDDRGVASLVRSVESGFLQLVPALPSSSATAGEAKAAAAVAETRVPPAQLVRLIAHGVTARRLVDRVREQLQRRVESLLAHAVPRSGIKGAGAPAAATAAPCEKSSNVGQLNTARDALTELTSLWVAVRWQLARLQAHRSDYTAQHMDLETLTVRQEQQQVYGRTTAKELRILRALKQATPVLPVTAKDEEARLRRWVAEQRQQQSQSRMAVAMSASFLLLDALVCTALVPLNTADPSAQQRLLDEAIRAMLQAEEECAAKKPRKRSSNLRGALSSTRAATAVAAEALVLYTPVLLWCYLAEACYVYGTREQAERVRAVLDAQMLKEIPAITNYTNDGGAVTAVTTSFVQRLMLQPKWSTLHASSTTTQLAYCRTLSSMAAVDTSKAASGSDALGSLQMVYRLVLALQIQRMLGPSEAHGGGPEGTGRGTSGSPTGRRDSLPSSSAAPAFTSSPLAVDTAQQLVAAILNYLTRSSGNTESRPTLKTAGAPLLLPPLVALCDVLLGLPLSSPEWADAAVQLLAVRVLTLFKEQLAYVMSSTMTAAGAVACLPAVADAMLWLLWTTLVHVWNNVLRNPNARQRRSLLAVARETQWVRRVYDGHQRLMQHQEAAEGTLGAESDEKGAGGSGKSGRHARNGSSEAAAGARGDSGASTGPVPSLDFPGVVYLAFEGAPDGGSRMQEVLEAKAEKGDDVTCTASATPAPLSPASAAMGAADSSKRSSACEPSTVPMHASAPADLVELLEEVVLHVPTLWPLIFSAAMDGGAVTDADAGAEGSAHEAVGAMASPKPPRRGKDSAEEAEQQQQQPLMDSLADFVRFAGQNATRVLRSQPAAPIADVASPSSASGVQSPLLRLQGVPAIYADVVVALRQYSAMITHGAATAVTGAAAARGGGGSRAHTGGGGGTASAVLLDVLGKYKDDPAYAKMAVHTVREMLTMFSDAHDNLDNGSGVGGGTMSASAGTGTAARKRNTGTNAPGAEVGITSIAARSTSVAVAAAIISDVRLVMHAVREQVEQNRRSMEAYLDTVDSETRAWLARDWYGLCSSPQQEVAANAGARESLPIAASAGKKDGGKAAANKRKLANRGAAAKKSAGKSGAPGGNEGGHEDEEKSSHPADDEPSYTTVTRVWNFAEQHNLKRLTCAVAWWRRRRAARTLRHRYTQYNMPFMAQMHLYEAALLHMGATAQYTAVTHERRVQELLRLVSGDGSGDGDPRTGAAVDRKLAVFNPTASAAAAAATQGGGAGSGSPEKLSNSISGTLADTPPDLTQTTTELLQHCARAALLFQYLWLPTRASTAVQLAVRHLQQLRVTLPQKGLSVSSAAAITALVNQLLEAPLFSIAAVQHGYWDARRDVHAGVLQPTVVKVGADVSWRHRFRFHRSVPSLLSLVSLLGQHEEMQSVQEARLHVLRQRQHEELQLRLCVESEAATRAEAERDELQAKVSILQQMQELLPQLRQSAAVKATLLAAAELLTSFEAGLDHLRSRHRSSQGLLDAPQTVSVLSRESVHAAAAEAASTIQYFTFESVPRGDCAAATSDARGTMTMAGSHKEASPGTGGQLNTCSGSGGGDAAGLGSVGAAHYGRDMREAVLVEQLTCLARVVVSVQPTRCEAAYRVAQRLTAGRYAEELLPRILQIESESLGQPRPETRAAYDQAIRNVPEVLVLLRAARTARAQVSASEAQATNTHQQQLLLLQPNLVSAESLSAEAMPTRDPSASDTSSSWKAAVKQYQRAAQGLRAAGLIKPLGECLYEEGGLYYAASHVSEATKRWSDAVDCFLSTPHALEDWHRHRTAPPAPPSGRRSLEELLWITAALTAVANHAFPTDTSRATDATLLCALLVHQSWRLPGVVSTAASSDGAGRTAVARAQQPHLPPAQYCLLDVHHVSASFSDALRPTVVGVSQQHSPTGMPGALADVTRRLISAAQSLLTKPSSACYSSESAVLAAFSDFVATIVLQDVELTVEARLVRAAAAAHLGSFSVAMRHVYGVCIGAGLPQPVLASLGAEATLPGFYSLGCAAASSAGATAAAVATSLSSPLPSGSATAPSSFYKDEESPSSSHNTAAVRAFLAACLPGLPLDAVAKHNTTVGNSEAGVSALLPLTVGVLASAALEERYGACLTRRVQLAIAELLVRLGTCDSAFLLMAPPTVATAAAASSSLATATSSSAPSNSAGGGGGQNRTSLGETMATPRVGSGSSRGSQPPPLPPAATGRGDRPVNACTEACRYASALLQSLASADVCFILTGQSSPSGVMEGGGAAGVGATRPSGSSAATTVSSSQASKARPGTSSHGAAAGASEAVAGEPRTDVSKQVDGTDGGSGGSVAPGSPCAAWLGSLRAIRQHALLLTAELLAAQGHYGACLRWLAACIAEHNEAQQYELCHRQRESPSSSAPFPSHATSTTPHPPSRSQAPHALLKGLGVQGGDEALAPFWFPYNHWVRVWLLMCRCYGHLRQYPQLEEAAGTQGLPLCTAFGVAGVQKSDNSSIYKDASCWTVFRLYRLYALMQMGRLREADDVVEALQLGHCAAAATSSAAAVTADSPAMGIAEDRWVAAAALRWWRTHRGKTIESAASRDALEQQVRWAITEHGVHPWRPSACSSSSSSSAVASPPHQLQHYVLVSPSARTILPSLALSRCATTATLWRLHDTMNHHALEQQQLSMAAGATPAALGGGEASSDEARGSGRAPQQRLTTPNCGRMSNSTSTDMASTSLTSGVPAIAPSGAAASLVQALEVVSPQYITSVHASFWFESQLWAAQLKVQEVCAHLLAGAREAEVEAVVRGGGGGGAATRGKSDSACVASQTGVPPLLLSREDVLRALPAPVRNVCDELLRVLHCCVELPVQRHAYVRAILLDLTRIVSTYVRLLRARQHHAPLPQGTQFLSPATTTESSFVSQLESIAAACALLAGLVSDMERRVRTGADSLRGYATDPRVTAAASAICEANTEEQGQAPWPESLWAALQRIQDTVGRLVPIAHSDSAGGSGAAGPADVLSNPFYNSPSIHPKQPPLGSGAASSAGSTGAESDRGASAGRGHRGSSKRLSGPPAPGTLPTMSATVAAQLSVPTMALTYAMLCNEAAAARALTPVTDALEHDIAQQLVTRHLQRLTTPANCTYLCYRDKERQALLESVGAVLRQQQQQPQQSSRRGGSSGHSRRVGAASSSTNAATGAGGGGGSLPSVRFTEADVWKALAPPVLLAAVPTSLFSALGADALGAPLYNSVAAAAVCVVAGAGAAGGAAAIVGRDSSDGGKASQVRNSSRGGAHEARWQLYLSVSPLQDAEVATAPPPLLPGSVVASLENCVLLPPSHILNAVAASAESSGAGAAAAMTTASASVSGTAASRARIASRQSVAGGSAGATSSHARCTGGSIVNGADRGTGGAWWPPLIASAATSTRELLVPSTNWALLDSIQQCQLQQQQQQRESSRQDTDGGVKLPPSPSLAAPAAPATRGVRKLGRRSSFGSVAALTAAAGGGGGGASNAALQHKNDGAAPPCEPAPLRWTCVSLEVSGSTVRTLRRHLRAVRACMWRVEAEEGTAGGAGEDASVRKNGYGSRRCTEDAVSGATGTGAAAPTAVEAHGAKRRDDHSSGVASLAVGGSSVDSDSANDHAAAARCALAAAVAQAQSALRSRVLAGGSGGGGVGGTAPGGNGAPPSAAQGAAGDGGARAGFNSSYPGGSSSAGSAAATSPSTSAGRKTANKTSGPGRNVSRASSFGGHGNGAPAAGGADGLQSGIHVTHDLADAARARQVAERRRRLQQLEEELDEAKSSLLMELLETIVSAACASSLCPTAAEAMLDEARIEADVQRLLPRCVLSSDVIGFLEEWIGSHAVLNVHGKDVDHDTCDDGGDDADGEDGCSGRSRTTSLRFYSPGLHEWMQRISRYVVEQQQQQR